MRYERPRRLDSGGSVMSQGVNEPPARAADAGPRSRWRSPVLFLSVYLVVTALVGMGMMVFLRSFVSGSRTTRMMLAQAEQVASDAPPGDTPQQLQGWISKVPRSKLPELATCGFARKHKNGVFYAEPTSWWLPGAGRSESDLPPLKLPAAAEDAGLKKDDVSSFFEIRYPPSDVTSNGYDVVAIYFFFDAEDRLIKHWVAVLRTDVRV
jgi:hypothetical protein